MGKSCGVGRDEGSLITARQDARLQEGAACAAMRAATPFPTERHTFVSAAFPHFRHFPLIMPQERPRRKHATAVLAIRIRPDIIGDDPPHIGTFPRPLIHSPTRAAAKGSCGFKTFTCFM